MRWTLGVLVSSVALIAIVGCSSSPGATTPPGGATQPPGGATPTAPSATQPATGATGHECDAVPTFSLTDPNPGNPPQDTALIAHFPTEVDGQPVTDAQGQAWIYSLCAFGGQAAVDRLTAGDQSGFNIASMSFGEATANVDGEDVTLTAFRTAGGDANSLIQSLALLAAQAGNGIDITGSFTTANVGGKNLYVATDTDGNKSYAYVSGDTLISFDSVTDSQAAKIAAALP